MEKTPKALRLHIGVFGRTNVGKSSFLNMVAGQDVAITSPVAGTTTDVVEKAMELLPVGPVIFLDTAGLDDFSQLADQRIKKTEKVFHRADIACLILEPNVWGVYEERVVERAGRGKIPLMAIVNKIDEVYPDEKFLNLVHQKVKETILVSSLTRDKRDEYINEFKKTLLRLCPDDFFCQLPLISDLIGKEKLAILIIPIDFEAPKGRILLAQTQTIRDALDGDACVLVVKENQYTRALSYLKEPPALVVCDSQVVDRMVAETPLDYSCTTFSILFSRYKGDLNECVRGLRAFDEMKAQDKILIAESCSHHAIEDDIARVKIPRWLSQHLGFNLDIDMYSGKDYPEDLGKYSLIIHCGGCMTNRKEMLYRIDLAKRQGVAITNYGVCISFLHGVLERVLSPFPEALTIYRQQIIKQEKA